MPTTPGPLKRAWFDLRERLGNLRERLGIDVYCERCNDLCQTKDERRARLCAFDLAKRDLAEERYFKSPDPFANSPFSADVIRPGDPGWDIFEAVKDGNAVIGTYDADTGQIMSMDVIPETQGTSPFPYGCCWSCTPNYPFMLVCQTCGNKRCPHANDHRNECTGSNEVGQPGSAYQ